MDYALAPLAGAVRTFALLFAPRAARVIAHARFIVGP
jgi:hypothetical protein